MASRICGGGDAGKDSADAAAAADHEQKQQLDLPKQMMAAVVESYALDEDSAAQVPSCVRIAEDHPVPDPPGRGQLLLRVHAVALNAADRRFVEGFVRNFPVIKPPYVMGFDVAGVVVSAGPGCERLKAGDAVYGEADIMKMGMAAEYAVVDEARMAHKPAQLSYAEAACFGCAWITAMYALDEVGPVEGSRGLVLGGTGGVASATLQLAKALGAAEVACTCSPGEAAEFARAQGADRTHDYHLERKWWDEFAGENFDWVIDTVGGTDESAWDNHAAVCRDDKPTTFASIMIHEPPDRVMTLGIMFTSRLRGLGRRVRSVFTNRNYALVDGRSDYVDTMGRIEELRAAGKVRPVIDRAYKLDRAAEALAYVTAGHARGKVVIEVSDSANKRE